VDLGKGEYCRQTFYSTRYKILWTGSKGHNVPLVNDCEQLPGPEYRATDITYSDSGHFTTLTMELSKAYPEHCGLKTLRRSMRLNRQTAEIEITDRFEFRQDDKKNRISIPLYIASQADHPEAGRIILTGDDGTTVAVHYIPEAVTAEIE
jgi:hypothetical protein